MFLIEFAGLLAPGEDVGGVGSRVEVVLVWVVFRNPIDHLEVFSHAKSTRCPR